MLNENVNISQVSTKMHYNTDSWKSKDQTFILILEEARKNPIFKEKSNSRELQWQHATRKKATVWSNKNQTFTRSKKLWMMKFTSKDDLDFGSPHKCQYSEAFEIVWHRQSDCDSKVVFSMC